MRRIREGLRLRHEGGLQQRLISASVGISKGSVSDYLARAEAVGLTWARATVLDERRAEVVVVDSLHMLLGAGASPASARPPECAMTWPLEAERIRPCRTFRKYKTASRSVY